VKGPEISGHIATADQWFPVSLEVCENRKGSVKKRRLLVACHGFSRLENFFGKAQNKMVNQQSTGNLKSFVSEKC